MPNMRIVHDNAADRATLQASSTAGNLPASNLLNDKKSEVWRSVGKSAALTLTWPVAEPVAMVALPFCSLTAGATFSIRGYADGGQAVLLDTQGTYSPANGSEAGQTLVLSTSGTAFSGETPWDWGNVPLGVNGYSHAGAGYAVIWFPVKSLRTLIIDIVDNASPLGYIEAGRLVVGNYWSPVHNAEVGAQITAFDESQHTRNAAGELLTDRGAQYKGLSLNLQLMPPADRDQLFKIVRRNGMSRPVFISMTPENPDANEERLYQLFGKMTKSTALTYQFLGAQSTQLELQEV